MVQKSEVLDSHFSVIYEICMAACSGDKQLGRSSVKKLANILKDTAPDDARLLTRLTKRPPSNPVHFVQSTGEQ
ncbi:hypothetical protein A9R05_42055 (plasmid) [Burkholderia sp. KK1]|uniref:Uncharacterized protein n=1 Tax=Burkholderia sp. M701 TaxID=326454 RepID=V5YPK4_9BURK|nr:hypothetical protein [Burkholderia sp. M701]AQH05609.1 hypothetical protein A9R05_42055 [Burkholderia sp. KK1]BAO18871.1 hypothetical protein [Burkholderia sp. M701]